MKKLFKICWNAMQLICIVEVYKHIEQIEKLNKEIEELKTVGKGE